VSDIAQTGETVPLRVFALSLDGGAATGKTDLFVRVQRSDDLWLDFADAVFKASGWTTRDASLTEVDASLAAGVYELAAGIVTTGALADDTLTVYPLQTPGSDVATIAPGEVRLGRWVDDISPASAIAIAVLDEDVTGRVAAPNSLGRVADLQNKMLRGRLRTNPILGQLELYDPADDGVLLTWPLTDFGGGSIANVASAPFDRAKAVET